MNILRTFALAQAAAVFFAAAAFAMDQRPTLESGDKASHAYFIYDDMASVEDVRVFPPDPSAEEPVIVTARVVPPALGSALPTASVYLKWRLASGGEWSEMEMTSALTDRTFYFARLEPQPEDFEFAVGVRDLGGSVVQEAPAYSGGFPLALGPETVRAADPDDSDVESPADLDVLETAAARDGKFFYVDFRVEGKISNGTTSPPDFHFYACLMVDQSRQKPLANLIDAPVFVYSPLIGTIAPFKTGVYSFAKIEDIQRLAEARQDHPDFEYKVGKNRISIKMPLDMMNAAPDAPLQAGCFASSLTDFQRFNSLPRDMGPYLRLLPGGRKVKVKKTVEPAPLWAGAAQIDVTPPIGTPLGGYTARAARPSTGVRDPLMAAALALKAGERAHVFASVDIVLFTHEMFEKTVRIVERETGLSRYQISIGATHTHTGSGAMTPMAGIIAGPYRPEVQDELVRKVAEAIVQAWTNLRPASFARGISEIDLTHNRVVPNGPEDHDLQVFRFSDSQGKPIAILFNYATHPVTRGESMEFSADYPGEVREKIAARWPGTVGVFFNGTEGNQNPKGLEGMGVGEAMGNRVVEMAEGMGKGKTEVALRSFWTKMVLNKTIGYESIMQGVRLDDAALITVPGEMFVETGRRLKDFGKSLGYGQVALLGLTSDTVAYITPEEIYRQRPYEALFTLFGEGEAFFIETMAKDLLARLH